MHLPKDMQRRLVDEYNHAAEQMRVTENPFEKLYFFSVLFGEASRVLNWTWDRELVLLHNVCQHTHQQVNARLAAIASGGEKGVGVPKDLFEQLTDIAAGLASYIEGPQSSEMLNTLLGRLAELAYATTGNGYYLYSKGVMTQD